MDVLELIHRNPCRKLKKMPHNPDPKYIPPEIDVLKLIAAADPKTDERDLILTLLYSMARIDEILRLKWEDVNFEKRELTKWTRKRAGGSYDAVEIGMCDELIEILKKRWDTRKNQIWVFYNEKTGSRYTRRPKLMNGLCKRAGIDPSFGFHALRHFVASMLADSGKVSKKTIGALLGHKELKTTEIYLHSNESTEREAINILSGRFGT
jgi:integrase